MDRRRQILQHQQQRFRRHVSTSDASAFSNLLMTPELLDRVKSVLPVHRNRLYPPIETLSMFLAQGKRGQIYFSRKKGTDLFFRLEKDWKRGQIYFSPVGIQWKIDCVLFATVRLPANPDKATRLKASTE